MQIRGIVAARMGGRSTEKGTEMSCTPPNPNPVTKNYVRPCPCSKRPREGEGGLHLKERSEADLALTPVTAGGARWQKQTRQVSVVVAHFWGPVTAGDRQFGRGTHKHTHAQTRARAHTQTHTTHRLTHRGMTWPQLQGCPGVSTCWELAAGGWLSTRWFR